jgi:retron-type reverse transcriptase
MPKDFKRYPLEDCAFYKMRSRKRMAKLLFTSEGAIQNIIKRDDLYKRKWKHKTLDNKWLNNQPKGKDAEDYRPIDIPLPKLKAIQKRIAELLAKIEPPDYLFSPVKKRSYVDNAQHHKTSDAFWSLDIADFFPSCSANNVAWFFGKVLGCEPDIVKIFVQLTTLNGSLPQGSPCSPILAYYSNQKMWDDVKVLAEKYDCKLSIYADDITISGKVVPKELIWNIKQRVRKQRLSLKASKEKNSIHNSFEITGVIIHNGKSLLPNRKHRMLGDLNREYAQAKNTDEKKTIKNRINGRLAQRKQVES